MRVALVIERFEPGVGGAEGVAWNLARGLAKAGEEVHVVARSGREAPGVTLHRVGVPAAWQPLRVLAFSRAAARALARHDIDCSVSFARTLHQDVYRAGGGCHADYMERRYGRLQRLWRLSPRHAVLLATERRIFRDPGQHVVCISQMVRSEIQSRYGVPDERISVIYNGVDLEGFHPRNRAEAGARFRSSIGVGSACAWLFAGSGFARKGLDTALRALARGGPADAQLWIAGRDDPGPWHRLARRLGVAERVRFLGFRRDIAAAYAAADALLLPTRYDAFGNVCLEAAAAGLPVVTSGAAGAAALFRSIGGVVEDPEDVDGFAAELLRLADRAQRKRQGSRARQVAEGFALDRQLQALRAELQRLTHSKQQAPQGVQRRDEAAAPRFAPLHTPYGRGLRRSGSDPAALLAALAAAQPGAQTRGWTVLKADERARVLAGPTPDGSVVVKSYAAAGWLRRGADVLRGSPARRAWRGAHGLLARGIAAATPRAFVERRRFGFPVASAIVFEDLRHLDPADRRPASLPDARRVVDALLDLALRLHRAGIAHGDLKASHALLGWREGRFEAHLIDLEAVRFKRRLGDRERIQALAELNASLPDCFPDAMRLGAFSRYADDLPFRCGREAARCAIVAISLERNHRWRGGECGLAGTSRTGTKSQ